MVSSSPRHVAVVGGGPAGLMAADVISRAGVSVTIIERMPTPGRKLLMAGRGGLNLTHSEPLEAFLGRYGAARDVMASLLAKFSPEDLVRFAYDLGQETFIGSSGRVFPKAMKASPLLRSLMARLARQGVALRTRCHWTGLNDAGAVLLRDASGATSSLPCDDVVLALGGASWPRLGSDGAWAQIVSGWGVSVTSFSASNAGIGIPWTESFASRFQGEPLKRIAVSCGISRVRGEAIVTAHGLEGGAVYALGPALRAAASGAASGASGARVAMSIDLRPDMDIGELARRLGRPKAKQSTSNWLRKALGLPPVAIALLREARLQSEMAGLPDDVGALAALIKAVPLTTLGVAGLDRAISTAGGIALDEIDAEMMLKRRPGVFVAGEMLDWDAPTGGYLLQACFAMGAAAGHGVVKRLQGA